MASRRLHKLLEWTTHRLNQAAQGADAGTGAEEDLYSGLYLDAIREHTRDLPARLSVVDGGCGVGRFAVELARAGHDVLGIEVHTPSLEEARRRADAAGVKLRLEAGELLRTLRGLPDASVDLALCLGVLYTCVDHREILGEFARVLRPGGRLLASFRTAFYFVTTLLRQGQVEKAAEIAGASEARLRIARVPAYYNWQSPEAMRALYAEQGLQVEALRPVGVFSGVGYDGMAAVADAEALSPSDRDALRRLEAGVPDAYAAAARFVLVVGRKQ